MNTRIKLVRKDANLTMEMFGQRLGVTRTAISNIENGHRSVTPQMVRSICREFDINEEWLKTGNGEMKVNLTKNQEIVDFMGALTNNTSDSDFRKRFIVALSKLSLDEWKVIEKLIDDINKKET